MELGIRGHKDVMGSEGHSEGPVAKFIEEKTARLPSDTFLWAAGASVVGALVLHTLGRKAESNFVGQWAPTILILGLYNKLVKLAGSEPNSIHSESIH